MQSIRNWRDVYRVLSADIHAQRLKQGGKLSSQSELARRYGTSRHAVRRALKALADEGLISCWQGREATLLSQPVIYQIGQKTRLATGLRARGHSVEVGIVQTRADRRLSAPIAELLGMVPGTRVPFAEFIHHVDGLPTALGRHYFNGRRFPRILEDATAIDPSVPKALVRNGVPEYFRAGTFVAVRQPTAKEALMLEIPPSQAVFSLLGKNVDEAGMPIEVTEAVVRSDTVTLQIDPHQVADLA